MKCENCGYENEQGYSFCPNCGAEAQPQTLSRPSAADRLLCVLKDNLFLVICILMSASCILSLSVDSVPLINILITVFLWLTYAQSRKGIADAKHLRCVSGAVYAQYVITYVLAGLMLLVGAIFALAFGFLANDPDFLDTLLSGFVDTTEYYAMIAQGLASVSGGLILFAFALIAAIMVVINIFSLRYIHRFAKSVYQSIEAGALALKHTKATQICLYIIGGLSAASALSGFATNQLLAALNSATSAAITIIAGLLIRKYLSSEE